MSISLNGYTDMSSRQEHWTWLINHASLLPSIQEKLQRLEKAQFSILNYPKFFSGERLFETKIKLHAIPERSAYKIIKKLIVKEKERHSNCLDKLKEIEKFEQDYEKYFLDLKRKTLIETIHKIRHSLEGDNDDIGDFKLKINQILSQSSLLKMQMRHDCLQAHLQITLVCNGLHTELAKKEGNHFKQKEKIKQIKVLAKRVIDSYYKNTKKISILDAVQKDISAAASAIGLVTALAAASLAIGSFFFPPLAFYAMILGTICFISYLSSLIAVIKMAEESIQYKRSPNPSEVMWLMLDILTIPVGLGINQFISLTGKIFHLATATINILTHVWNDIISNIIPIFSIKNTISNTLDLGATYTKTGQLKNTNATSWRLIRSALSIEQSENSSIKAFEKMSMIKNYIAQKIKHRPAQSPKQQRIYSNLVDYLESTKIKRGSGKMTELSILYDVLKDYIALQTSFNMHNNSNYVEEAQYSTDIRAANAYLYKLSSLCDQYCKRYFDNIPFDKLNPSTQACTEEVLAIQTIILELIAINDQSLDEFNHQQAYDNTLEQYNRGFAYTSLNTLHSDDYLSLTPSRHAAILFWDEGFTGLRNSKETKDILEVYYDYRELPADVSKNERMAVLGNLGEKCGIYLKTYQNVKATKGRYGYVAHLAQLVQEEIMGLSAIDNPILVGYKSRSNR